MLGDVKLKPGKRPRKPIYIIDEAALKEGEGGVGCQFGWLVRRMEELEKIERELAKEDVHFLLKEPVEPIDLHAANKALPNTSN